ncbi:hypothetical protein RUND412_000418 [Rhizina undulata]
MDRLSNEILQEIVSYLFASDINSIRLVNRRFSATANIFKFRALHVRISRKGLDNLLNISRQPELAQCVREITYPLGRLSPARGPTFDDEADEFESPMTASPKSAQERLKEEFIKWHMERYCTQIELEESGECVRTIETALSRMSNIRDITSGYNNSSMRTELEIWQETFPNMDSAINSDFWLEPIEEGEEQALKTTLDLIITSHRLGIKLDSFDFIIAAGWLRLGIFYNNSELWGCASLFKNLTCLSVFIMTMELDSSIDLEGMENMFKKGHLHKFLALAPNLRKLALVIEGFHPEELFFSPSTGFKKPVFSLLDVLGRSHVWNRLHSFHLQFTSMILEELVKFLGRHAETLRCLSLQSPVLLVGTWRELLDFLKERLHITDFEIESPCEDLGDEMDHSRVYNADAQRRMENYVLRGGAPFPPTKQELEESGWDISTFLEDWGGESEEEEDV